MRPSAPAREAITTAAIALIAAIELRRLRSGDERRQAIDAARVRHHRLGLRLILRLRTMLARLTVLARLLLIALIGLAALALLIALIVVAHIGLRLLLLRHKARLLSEI